MKTKVFPVVVGALGTLRKDFTKGVELIPGRPNVSEIHKISLLGTAHILRKVLGGITKSTGSVVIIIIFVVVVVITTKVSLIFRARSIMQDVNFELIGL